MIKLIMETAKRALEIFDIVTDLLFIPGTEKNKGESGTNGVRKSHIPGLATLAR